MKTLFVTLVAMLLALIIGCHENMLNEPETSLGKMDQSYKTDKIKICCQVRDPLTGSCNLSGYVTYIHQIIKRTQHSVGLNEISLHLEMDSEMCDKLGMVHLEWRIKGKSDDIVYVSEEGILFVEKSYTVSNRNDVVLLVQYLVTTDGVGISNVSLAEIEK